MVHRYFHILQVPCRFRAGLRNLQHLTNPHISLNTGSAMQFDLETAVKHPHRIRHRNSDTLRFSTAVFLRDLDALILQNGDDGRLLLYRKGEWDSFLLLAPETQLAPWSSPDEIPDGCWFREISVPSRGTYLLTGVNEADIRLAGRWVSMGTLFRYWEYATSRKGPWLPCGKEVQNETV